MKKDFGDLLRDSWKEYKDNFKVYFKIFLLFYVIISILLYGLLFFVSYKFNLELVNYTSIDTEYFITQIFSNNQLIFYFVLLGILALLSGLAGVFMKSSFLYNVLYRKKQMNTKETIRGGKKYFWKFFLFLIVEFIFLGGLFLLFIIPGIIFAVFWIFAVYVLIGENKGIIESFKESYNIVKGRWWKTFGYILLFFLVIFILSISRDVISFIIGLPLLSLPLFYNNLFNSILNQFLNLGLNLITIPLGIIYYKNLYLEMKKDKK